MKGSNGSGGLNGSNGSSGAPDAHSTNGRHGPIRVLIADDSISMCALLVTLLEGSQQMHVVGVAHDGADAVRLTARLRPDVVVLDVRMPQLDGLAATRAIMRERPTPIVIMSSDTRRDDIVLAFDALRAGALTVVRRPELSDREACDELVDAVRLVSTLIQGWMPQQT